VPSSVDVAGGLLFRITPEGKEAIRHVVLPAFYTTQKFIEPPKPEIEQFTIKVPFVRLPQEPGSPVEPLVPDAIPIALSLPPELRRLMTGGNLGGAEAALAFGEQETLWAELSVANNVAWGQIAQQGYEISASVAGLPHAFRWRLDPNGQLTSRRFGRSPVVRIAEPADWQMLKQGEKYKLRIEVDATELDLANWDGPRWTLECQLMPERGDLAGSQEGRFVLPRREIHSSHKRQVSLQGLAGGEWSLAMSADDYEQEWSAQQQLGRFRLHARLMRNGALQAEDSRAVIIDNEQPPALPVFVKPNANGEHRIDRALVVSIDVEDPQSGIKDVLVGIDLNNNRRLDEDEIVPQRQLDPIANPRARLEITIPRDRLPEDGGNYNVLVQVANGMDVASKFASLPLTFRKPPMTVKPEPNTGRLEVKAVGNFGMNSITVKGPVERSRSGLNGVKEIKFDDLPPGEYTVTVQGRGGRKGGGTVKVEAREKPSELTVRLTL
jgi:hypothetical protein